MKPRIVKLRSGFLATTVPGSALLDRDGVPLGADDEFSRIPSAEEAEKPLAELFAHVPQDPWPAMADDPVDWEERRRWMDAVYASEEA